MFIFDKINEIARRPRDRERDRARVRVSVGAELPSGRRAADCERSATSDAARRPLTRGAVTDLEGGNALVTRTSEA